MLSLYLFALVYVTLCCFTYSPQTPALKLSTDSIAYEVVSHLDTDVWFSIVEPLAIEVSNDVESLESKQETNTEATASFSVSSDVDSDESLTEVGASLTKKELMHLIKSNGYYTPNLSQKKRSEVLEVYREMVQTINAGHRS